MTGLLNLLLVGTKIKNDVGVSHMASLRCTAAQVKLGHEDTGRVNLEFSESAELSETKVSLWRHKLQAGDFFRRLWCLECLMIYA